MKRPIHVVLFDLGGTLFFDDPAQWPDTYRQAEDALWSSLRESGVRAKPEAVYRGEDSFLQYYYRLRATGLDEPGAGRVLRELLARRRIVVPESSLRKALQSMYATTQANWHLETDSRRTLEQLRSGGLRLGVVSNGSDDDNARSLLEKAELLDVLEFVLTSAAFGRRKPDPAIFRAALHHFEVAPALSAMVGDNYEADIVGANRVGMSTVWITRRIAEPATLPQMQPTAKVSTLAEIPALLL